jgi:hypothetical protein
VPVVSTDEVWFESALGTVTRPKSALQFQSKDMNLYASEGKVTPVAVLAPSEIVASKADEVDTDARSRA